MTGWCTAGSKCPIGRHVGQRNVVYMKALIAAAALVAATLVAPAGARADTADDTFVGYAQSVGISASRADLVQAGHEVCGLLSQGPAGDGATSPIAVASAVTHSVPSVTDLREAAGLAHAAVAAYCPLLAFP